VGVRDAAHSLQHIFRQRATVTPVFTQFLAKQRLAALRPYLRGDVLDLGCGGDGVISCLRPGQGYVGVDWRAEVLRQLQVRYPQYTFYQRDFDREPLLLGQDFDTVVLLAVIEHLRKPETLFAQLRTLLRPDGRVVMTSPSGWGNWLHGFGARVGLFSREAAAEHHIIFSRERLATMLQPHGLVLERYRTFLLGGNQLFVCRLAGAVAG
jgi:2-polyprenyl-3-methyl-5-hydroxy-6-metoxy-1,4-benzoquinol methylase